VVMQNRSRKIVNIERGLKLPESLNLLNSTTASQAVFQQSLRNTNLVSG
jgi:hypothetical protein